ncbi:MAG: hypothetical protein LUE93_03970 [Bacteroides sp.]|nr:hypothetical protein [Bacteroides sp.]
MIQSTRYVIFLLFCILLIPSTRAQFVNYGTDPTSLKWSIVKTDHYKVIYPRQADSLAYRYVTFLENVYPHMGKTIGKGVNKRFPVILHPASMLSNGLVAWAPRRMELIPTPSSTLYAQSWDRQLVIHESRHVFQMEQFTGGVFRPFYWLAGEQISGVAAFAVPKWFFEGDAVATETALSNSGRGRLPEFQMTYRARKVTDNFFSMDKWFLGSYKDYTGDYYALGYDMTAYARYQYGVDIWDRTTHRYTRRFFRFPPFSNAFKHYSGTNTSGLFKETFEFLGEEWSRQEEEYREYIRKNPAVVPAHLSPLPRRYASYKYPQYLDKERVVAVKSSYEDINSVVMLRDGQEEHIAYLGVLDGRPVLRGNTLYWCENVSGLRWTHRNYIALKKMDVTTGKITTLTRHKRYMSPAVDREEKVVALSYPELTGVNKVVLVNAENGKEIAFFAVPENAFVKELTFTGAGELVASLISDRGITLAELNPATGEWRELLGTTSANITSLTWQNGKVYFETGLNGTNNVYYLDMENGESYRLTTARFGAFQPALSPDEQQLLYTDYQPEGYRIAAVALESLPKERMDLSKPYQFALAETIKEQEQFNLDTVALTPVTFEPKRYSKVLHGIKIHSWAPFYYDVNEAINLQTEDLKTPVKPGATVISQNSLNTAIFQAGWYYSDKEHHGKASLTYMGLFPVFDIVMDYGGKAFNMEFTTLQGNILASKGYYTNRTQLETEARVYLPFNFTRNHYIRGLQPIVTYFYTNDKYQQVKSGKMRDFQYLLSELRFYNYRKLAKQDIIPRWGYQVRLQYMTLPFNTENYGKFYIGRVTTYSPGLMRHHGLMTRWAYQYQSIDDKALYIPQRIIDAPRGYSYLSQTRQQWSFKGDYSFPLAYPDLKLGTLLYIQRIHANLFYDISRNQRNKEGRWETQSSYGADLLLDWNALRLNYPISAGIRVACPIQYGNVEVEGIFSISF